jgi:hypothetical protein
MLRNDNRDRCAITLRWNIEIAKKGRNCKGGEELSEQRSR